MGSSSPGNPPPVQPASQVAAQQQQINTQSAAQTQDINQVNQSGPSGSLTYTQRTDSNGNPMTGAGGIPLYTATTALSPENQRIYDALQGQGLNLIRGANYGGQDPTQVIGDATTGNTNAIMQHELDYLSPFFNPQISQLDTQLKNQGFNINDPAYTQAMNNLRQQQGQTVSGFLAQAEPQAYQQAYQNYMTPITTAGALFGQLPNANSGFVNTPTTQVTPANLTQAVANENSANMAAYNARVAAEGNMMSGIFGTGGAVLGGLARNPAILGAI